MLFGKYGFLNGLRVKSDAQDAFNQNLVFGIWVILHMHKITKIPVLYL